MPPSGCALTFTNEASFFFFSFPGSLIPFHFKAGSSYTIITFIYVFPWSLQTKWKPGKFDPVVLDVSSIHVVRVSAQCDKSNCTLKLRYVQWIWLNSLNILYLGLRAKTKGISCIIWLKYVPYSLIRLVTVLQPVIPGCSTLCTEIRSPAMHLIRCSAMSDERVTGHDFTAI